MKKLHLIISSVALMLVFNACSLANKELQVSEYLPRVEKVQTISDMTSIAFEWESKYNENIEGFYIYRGTEAEPDMKLIETLPDKYKTHYVDTNLKPSTKYFYTIKTYNNSGYISKSITIEVSTAERIAAMPFIESIKGLPKRIKLLWRPHPDVRVNSYVIERAKDNDKFKVLAEVPNRLSAEYIDNNLKADENFRYRIFAKTADGVYSQSSRVVSATTKALPAKVEYVSATTNVARKIIITWDKVEVKDFAHYKVYSSISKFLPFTLLAKVQNNRYEDVINEADESKYYKITAVDKDGLESPMPETAVLGKTLEAPKAPSIKSANLTQNGVELAWNNNDIRAVKFIVKRYGGSGNMVFREIKEHKFSDNSVVLGQKYSYEVIAVDINDIESKPSSKVSVGK